MLRESWGQSLDAELDRQRDAMRELGFSRRLSRGRRRLHGKAQTQFHRELGHEAAQAAQLRCRSVGGGRRRACASYECGDRRTGRRNGQRRARFQDYARPRAQRRRAGAPGDDLPRARLAAEGPRQCGDGAQGGAVRAELCHRRDAQGRVDRHRGRRGDAVFLLVERSPRIAERQGADRRGDGAAFALGQLRRPACLHAAAGRRGPYQRVQFPGLGNAGEARADLARGRAGDREARARRPAI